MGADIRLFRRGVLSSRTADAADSRVPAPSPSLSSLAPSCRVHYSHANTVHLRCWQLFVYTRREAFHKLIRFLPLLRVLALFRSLTCFPCILTWTVARQVKRSVLLPSDSCLLFGGVRGLLVSIDDRHSIG